MPFLPPQWGQGGADDFGVGAHRLTHGQRVRVARRANIIVIAGPTASGKTAVAVELARVLGTEIISADSMQVYQHLSISTAKPTAEELTGVRCHLVDMVEPGCQYSAGDFVRDAAPIVRRLADRGLPTVVCGGTGLYIRALLSGLAEGLVGEAGVRVELMEELGSRGLAAMYEELQRVDPGAVHIMPNDTKRIIRALEIFRVTGRPISALHAEQSAGHKYLVKYHVLVRPRGELWSRIDERVTAMERAGLVEEVAAYLAAGHPTENTAFHALGCAEVQRHLAGECELGDALDAMRKRTRQYARRQMIWFRGVAGACFVECAGTAPDEVARGIAAAPMACG